MKVICNSGPLMALGKIGQVHLLYPIYGIVFIPSAVYGEAVLSGLARGEPDAVSIEVEFRRQHLRMIEMAEADLSSAIAALPLDRGEKHAIQLAMNEKADWVLLDDMQARIEAKRLGLPVKGTLGVFVDAARQSVLNISEIDVIFEALLKREDIWISEGLIRHVWGDLNKKFGG
jgi:predicted nucleic acid-binding protein